MDAHIPFGELDKARMCGTRALKIARVLGDLDLRILTTFCLGNVHSCLGEYEQAIELTQGSLAALPANRIYDKFGRSAPASVLIATAWS